MLFLPRGLPHEDGDADGGRGDDSRGNEQGELHSVGEGHLGVRGDGAAQAGAAAEQAKQLAEVTEEALEELKEIKEGADQA